MIKTNEELEYTHEVICREIDSYYDSSWFQKITLDVFDEDRSLVRISESKIIHFSYPQYKIGAERNAITEYVGVVDYMKLPHFRDSDLRCCILTCEPETFLILHEIAHIVVLEKEKVDGKIYPEHGKEFCDQYKNLLQIVQPDMIFPF